MNYRHAFHAGNPADVLKHTVLLALLAALRRKESSFFVLDTHAGRGYYNLNDEAAQRTGEAGSGALRLLSGPVPESAVLDAYLAALRRIQTECGPGAYPGSPLLIARTLRPQDRAACCERHPEECYALKKALGGDTRVAVHQRDGYEAIGALLPPKERRGLVLIDPPYEAQLAEFDAIERALANGLDRWSQGIFAVWFPVKQRRDVQPFLRRAAALPCRQALLAELLVRPDDSPLTLNGSGMLILNPPWQIEESLAPAVRELAARLDQGGGSGRIEWLKREETGG